MVTRSSVRFTIGAEGHPRTLFSASEKADGTIIIRPKKDPQFRLPGQHPSGIKKPIFISSQKYSIHPSTNSKRGVNTIHSTTTLESGEKYNWHNLTKAIKSEEGFAFLSVRRCSDLAKPHFISDTPATTTIDLGSYDSHCFTLYYAIVAGARNVAFTEGETDIGWLAHQQVNVVNHVFARSRLTVLWTFLTLPSHSTSLTFHNTTVPPTNDHERRLMDGLASAACLEKFSEQCGVLEREQQMFMMLEAGKPLNEIMMVPVRRWKKDGSQGTGDTDDHVSNLTGRVISL
jgi:hypothetical protein